MHCTGILSPRLLKIIKIPKEIILNQPNKLNLFSKNKHCTINGNAIVIDRSKFDKFLARNLNIKLNTKFLSYKKKGKEIIIKTNKGKIKTNLLIAANGAKSNIIKNNKKFITGIQARIKTKHNGCKRAKISCIRVFRRR